MYHKNISNAQWLKEQTLPQKSLRVENLLKISLFEVTDVATFSVFKKYLSNAQLKSNFLAGVLIFQKSPITINFQRAVVK